VTKLRVIEICAGAGGQALGLERAGFEHELAIELDDTAVKTLKKNRPKWDIRHGDVADENVWNPADYAPASKKRQIDLLAGGVPCPPFSVAGKQLGANDERDLFAWAVEQVEVIQPRALLLENVRGLSMPRFAGYRQHVLDRLHEFGYSAEWQPIEARQFGVPQLRPRFVLIAMQHRYFQSFQWPVQRGKAPTVGETLRDIMKRKKVFDDDDALDAWVKRANGPAPTIVGGSKKHGGADLGPTRAKLAWEGDGC
jgi:DNA (cytosine-5)-methyltransferase 1